MLCWIRLPIAHAVLWFDLVEYQYIALLDSSPECSCGSFVGFVGVSVHRVDGFGSWLLMGLLGWPRPIVSTSTFKIQLPIADVAFWLALFSLQ